MLYSKRTVKCSALKMTRDAARESLERQFEDTEVLDLKRQGDKWVATLLEKQADFPPKDEGGEDPAPFKDESEDEGENKPSSDGGSDSEGEGPPKEKGHEKGGEKAELGMLLDLVTQMATAMGIAPPGGGMGGDDMGMGPGGPPGDPGMDPSAGMPPAGPPGAPPLHSGQKEILHRTKLGPGEVPPGGTPIGAPAFSSTNPDLSRLASFDAFDDTPGKTIKQAKVELDAQFGPQGFKVRQIKRVENGARIAAKLSRR